MMTCNNSELSGPDRPDGPAPADDPSAQLRALGWKPSFAAQTDADEMARKPPVRVVEVHRNGLRALGCGIETLLPPVVEATVGDWLLLDAEQPTMSVVLERNSLFKRRAPGSDWRMQMIAANVDTGFVVTSCNQEFNVARLERYVALIFEAGVTPVILLTKSDLCDDPAAYLDAARAISPRVLVVLVNARSDEPLARLAEWCGPGQTIAFLGSSGVGKSTLVNALIGGDKVDTGAIREDDARGRHTTRHRHLHFMPNGCAVLDTPGMRELQLTDAQDGIADLFEDLAELAQGCRFRDCKHETEPGCALRAARDAGQVDAARLTRWQKLVTEDRTNTATMARRKADEKALHKTIKSIQKRNRK